MKKFYIFIGTTAELIKIAPIIREFKRRKVACNIIATGQNNIVFSDMKHYIGDIKPYILFEDKNKQSSLFGFASWTFKTFFACLMRVRTEFSSKDKKETFLIVHGDTVSSVLGAIIGRIYGLRVVHIESGLRSYNFFEPFPEEICRFITSHLSTIHFAPNMWAVKNINGIGGSVINTKQNTLFDSYRMSLRDKKIPQELRKLKKKYFVLVIHRQEHVFFQQDHMKHLLSVILKNTTKDLVPVLINLSLTDRFLHETDPNLFRELKRKAMIIHRLPYSQFMKLIEKSEFLVTDGGSNQEESYYMGKPCLLLRNVTERIEGLGENAVLSRGNDEIIEEFFRNYKKYSRKKVVDITNVSKIIIDYLVKKG